MQERTPGVYIVEEDAFPNSVVEVPTGIPAFVGYTEKAAGDDGKSLLNQPVRITSLAEYQRYFGADKTLSFSLQKRKPLPDNATATTAILEYDDDAYDLVPDQRYYLYQGMQLFFQNGGSTCYIVSTGHYKIIAADDAPDKTALIRGIKTLEKEPEPSLLVVPDAVALADLTACSAVQNEAIAHCEKMQSRFAILDVYDGYLPRTDPENPDVDCVTEFREAITANGLQYAAAYYPWLETTLPQDSVFGYRNIAENSKKLVQTTLKQEFDDKQASVNDDQTAAYSALLNTLSDDITTQQHQTLLGCSPVYKALVTVMTGQARRCPPGSAIAGVYARIDHNIGVFKAPANTGISGVIKPTVDISHTEQEDLNVPLNGKAVNAIRTFMGRGILIWGARTLDGNSQDWRYINVRRTLIMLEQSIQLACKAYVFSPNDVSTWATVSSMLDNFLNNQWKAGALAGTKPADAYEVDVGLSSTMTANDILDGYMRITVKVAVVRPAEFIVLTFQQKMQTG